MAPTPLHPGFPGHTCRWPSLGALLQQGPLTAITSTINFSTLITTAWWHLTSTFCLPVTVLRALHMYPIWPSPQTCKTDPHILFILQVKKLGRKRNFPAATELPNAMVEVFFKQVHLTHPHLSSIAYPVSLHSLYFRNFQASSIPLKLYVLCFFYRWKFLPWEINYSKCLKRS